MTEEVKQSELILKAKELYSKGSRNYLLKCYSEAADELSEVCALYEEIYGELSDELGMPYLLYAKSLIALALEENKVIDVPDEEEDDDSDDEANETEDTPPAATATADKVSSDIEKKPDESEAKEPDSTEEEKKADVTADTTAEASKEKESVEEVVTSTEDEAKDSVNGKEKQKEDEEESVKPSTSNGITTVEEEEEEDNEAASSLQLAWEILELAAKIFTRQGLSGLPNLAEVQTELANIEFENNILDSARDDYEKALQIYKNLTDKYRRAMAEIHYKIGLTYLMQQMNPEGAESLKNACALIEDEINEMKAGENQGEKNIELIKDLEETKQEIWAKIGEIEETRQQNIAEVRAALDSYIGPAKAEAKSANGPSSSGESSSVITSSSKPTDITHLIKRKKADTPASSEAEASPAKRPAL